MKKGIALYWIRNDFRLDENQALVAACCYELVIPLFTYKDIVEDTWPLGSASKWWLNHSLQYFKGLLRNEGSDLLVSKNSIIEVITKLLKNTEVQAVFWNKQIGPNEIALTKKLTKILNEKKIHWESFDGGLLSSPQSMLKKDQSPYLVYTPFWKNFIDKYNPQKIRKPKISPLPKKMDSFSIKIETLKLLPKISWDSKFYNHWNPGEEKALEKLRQFLRKGIYTYNKDRDTPNKNGTSMLSAHLHFGEIHPKTILELISKKFGPLKKIKDPNIIQFCKEIVWREFAHHLLYYYPSLYSRPLKKTFANFPWIKSKRLFTVWCKGLTGYPIVDAGMRQLWSTGWMHNRVRMVAASFLIKHLNISWIQGAKWFWDTLVDADWANNSMGWQWVAGCGPDASPYFRIFNPVLQGQKFDPQGEYILKWCPELKKIPKKWIHCPWEAPKEVLLKSELNLGKDYPLPVVLHKEARENALSNYKSIK